MGKYIKLEIMKINQCTAVKAGFQMTNYLGLTVHVPVLANPPFLALYMYPTMRLMAKKSSAG
jgi:hypothetical protein